MRYAPLFDPRNVRGAKFSLAAGFSAWLLSSVASAALLDPGALLITTNTNHLVRYSFTGTQLQDLTITGITGNVVASGPAVLNGRLFVGFAGVSGDLPYLAEVNPTTGAIMSTFTDGTLSHLNRLGEDGTRLLALDSVNQNPFKVHEFSVNGAALGVLNLTPYATGFQSAGIAGDGQSIFTPLQSVNQPIVTNNYTGAVVGHFDTGLSQSSLIRGLAYNHADHTIWIQWSNTGNNPAQFRHYDLSGTLLGTVAAPNIITGLEVLPTPEPSSMALALAGALGLLLSVWQRRCRHA